MKRFLKGDYRKFVFQNLTDIETLRNNAYTWEQIEAYYHNGMTSDSLRKAYAVFHPTNYKSNICYKFFDEIYARRLNGEKWPAIADTYKVSRTNIAHNFANEWDRRHPDIEITPDIIAKLKTLSCSYRQAAFAFKTNALCIKKLCDAAGVTLAKHGEVEPKLLQVDELIRSMTPMEISNCIQVPYPTIMAYLKRRGIEYKKGFSIAEGVSRKPVSKHNPCKKVRNLPEFIPPSKTMSVESQKLLARRWA
jgi:hypothetical protein